MNVNLIVSFDICMVVNGKALYGVIHTLTMHITVHIYIYGNNESEESFVELYPTSSVVAGPEAFAYQV